MYKIKNVSDIDRLCEDKLVKSKGYIEVDEEKYVINAMTCKEIFEIEKIKPKRRLKKDGSNQL